MKIVVCIKQVPDTTEIKIDPIKNTLVRDGVPSIVNPFDEYAMEAAIKLKEQYGGTVTVLSMGPPQAAIALQRCVAMGADEGILISDRAVAGADTWATSFTLAKAIEKIGIPDIILCGKMAIDGDTGQVGPGIAQHLGLPQTTYVQKIRRIKDNQAIVERAFEGGFEVIAMQLPGLIAVDKTIGEPRFPSVKGFIRSSRLQVTVWSAADIDAPADKIGLDGSCTQVVQVFSPEVTVQSEILEGDNEEELCDLLISKLQAAKVM